MDSEFGSKYVDTNFPRNEMIVIRHLNTELAVKLFPIYEDLYTSITNWVNDNQKLRNFVSVPNLVEVGKDYFIRPFFVYDVSIRDYMDEKDEDYVAPPQLFEDMKNVISQELTKEVGREGIIQLILRKSLLEPTGKTFFSYKINKFIIVEPKILLADLDKWKSYLT